MLHEIHAGDLLLLSGFVHVFALVNVLGDPVLIESARKKSQ